MENKARELLLQYGRILQQWLFPRLEEELGALTEKHEQLVRVLGLVEIEKAVGGSEGRVGRPRRDRGAMARAFVAKAVYNLGVTRGLLDLLQSDSRLRRICGWERTSEVPDETVFSRAFAEFARTELPQRVHQALIRKTQQERLIGHISRDATAIAARERVAKVENAPAKKQLKVRRQRGTPRQPEEMTRIERQKTMTLAEMLGGPPHGLRRRLQDEQSRAQRDLARLPAASGCSRRTNPDQLRADVGESARQPSGDPAGYHNRGAGQQLVRPDGFGV